MKTDGCESCHQLGDKATREIAQGTRSIRFVVCRVGSAHSVEPGWQRDEYGSQSSGRKRLLTEYADWTDRIKAGELPPVPPRPQGKERNVVITQWDWSGQKDYFHDEITVDRWNPTTNPNGLVYGVHEESTDLLTILDPVKNSFTEIPIPSNPGTPAR